MDPRPDISMVDEMQVTVMVEHIFYLLNQDIDDDLIASDLRVMDRLLKEDPSTYCVVFDKLAQLKICTKAQWRAWQSYPET